MQGPQINANTHTLPCQGGINQEINRHIYEGRGTYLRSSLRLGRHNGFAAYSWAQYTEERIRIRKQNILHK